MFGDGAGRIGRLFFDYAVQILRCDYRFLILLPLINIVFCMLEYLTSMHDGQYTPYAIHRVTLFLECIEKSRFLH